MLINDPFSKYQQETEIALIDYGEYGEFPDEDFDEDFSAAEESEVEVDMKEPERRRVFVLDDAINADWIKHVRDKIEKEKQSKKDEAPKRED